MVINNLQAKFCLLTAYVPKRAFENCMICAEMRRQRTDNFMRVCVCLILAVGFVGFPLFRYNLYLMHGR